MAGRGTDILLGGNPDFLLEDMLRRAGKTPTCYRLKNSRRNKEQVKARD